MVTIFKPLERRQGEPSSFEEKKELIGSILRQAQEEDLVAAQKARLQERQVIQLMLKTSKTVVGIKCSSGICV